MPLPRKGMPRTHVGQVAGNLLVKPHLGATRVLTRARAGSGLLGGWRLLDGLAVALAPTRRGLRLGFVNSRRLRDVGGYVVSRGRFPRLAGWVARGFRLGSFRLDFSPLGSRLCSGGMGWILRFLGGGGRGGSRLLGLLPHDLGPAGFEWLRRWRNLFHLHLTIRDLAFWT